MDAFGGDAGACAPTAGRAPGEIAVAVEGVSKRYAQRTALADVSFSVSRGEFVAILGSSGAGKTTLIRCMAGLTDPDSGRILLDGTDVRMLSRRVRRSIAVVFQQFNLVGRLTAMDNVLAGRLGHVSTWRGVLRRFTRPDRLLALECLARVGLLAHARQRADTLSGGQQQRVAIARALAQRPRVILADEPISNLDPQNGAGILELLRGICHEDSVALVCSLHQVHFARAYADRIVGMAAGRSIVAAAACDFDEAAAARLYGEPVPDPHRR